MRTNGRIRDLLNTPCLNDNEYGHRVIWPLLDYLGIPSQARRPQFQIENPFGDGLLKLDFLIHHGDQPLVTIEGEPTAGQFDTGFKQARNYSRNFKPRQRGCLMQERTVPFLITAAGTRAEMYRAVVRGLNIEYELIQDGNRPAFLEWNELLAEAGQRKPDEVVSRQHQVLVSELANQFFTELFAAIDDVAVLRNKDDQKIILFNRVIDCARNGGDSFIVAVCRENGLKKRSIARVLKTISVYRQKIESREFTGAAVAHGYRSFLLQPGGRGAHRFFTGESQSRAYRTRGKVRYRNVARYFTPTEIIQQMVRLANPGASERVIDMTCGGGGFLAECVNHVSQVDGARRAEGFLTRRLVGIDDDPFCVSSARELLTFLYPQHASNLLVFLHNVLCQYAPSNSEIEEDPSAETHLCAGRYDLVIGNPPGNDEYSGTNRAEITREWQHRFGHAEGGLMDHHCFIRRAVELAKPNGGRICLLVPEGLLTRDNRGVSRLRLEVAAQCELRLVITLPRVFKGNNARMAIVYLVRKPHPVSNAKVILAEVRERWRDPRKGEQAVDLFGELETIVSHHLDL